MAHGTQKRASGDPVLRASARSRRDPHRPPARRRHHRGRGPARHRRGHRGDPGGDQPALRAGDRRARRRPDQAQAARPRLQAGRAGRELPQAAARGRGGRARAAGEARRPPAQHAHAPAHAGGEAPAHRRRRRWTSTRRSPAAWASRRCARSWRTWPSATSSRTPTPPSRSGSRDLTAEVRAAWSRASSRSSPRSSRAQGSRPRSAAGRSGPFSIWRRWSASRSPSSSSPTSSASASSSTTCGDCYAALGIVHTSWPMVPGRYKDYISTPKQNDYRSIHTTVIGPKSQRVELQIRTPRHGRDRRVRHRGARALQGTRQATGPARGEGSVHPRLAAESGAYQWLRRTVELLAEGDSPEEFLEHTKLELFQDQVFCFTPKGRLIALPRGATPIDFAYAVHTDVGNTAVGAKINGRMAPLLHELANGDEVEIVRSDGAVAAGRLGIARRDRQGPGGDPARDPDGGAPAICRPRPPDPGAGLRARGQDLLGRQAAGRPAAARPRLAPRTCSPPSAAGEMFSGRRGPGGLSRLPRRAPRPRAAQRLGRTAPAASCAPPTRPCA